MQDFPLGIPGAHQAYNAGLALSVFRQLRNTELGLSENNANEYIHSKGSALTNISEAEGLALRTTTWPGRCQKVSINENLTYFLDGAHTKESILLNYFFISLSRDVLLGLNRPGIVPYLQVLYFSVLKIEICSLYWILF